MKLIKIGAKVMHHARSATFQLMTEDTNQERGAPRISGPMWALFAFVFAITGLAIVLFWL